MPRRFSLKTRLLSLLLSAAMVLMFLPASAFAAADKQVLVGSRKSRCLSATHGWAVPIAL